MSVKIMDIEMTNDDYAMVNQKICNIYGMSWNRKTYDNKQTIIYRFLDEI